MKSLSRRRFVLVAAGGMGAAASGGAAWNQAWRGLPVVRQRAAALGTQVEIVVRHRSPRAARAAIAAGFAELALVENLLSIYRPDSQVSELNREGVLLQPHQYVELVLQAAERVARASGGAFDVTVQPLWKVFAAAARRDELPRAVDVAAARQRVNWRQVQFAASGIRYGQPGMQITLNGIAQGFATDRVLSKLREHGIEHALIDAGELSSLGRSDRGDAWRVGVQHPRDPGAYVALADLDGRALATSGDYQTKFSADGRHHHILDPRTGYSPTELASVSIVAPTAMEADAWSTACFVLGPQTSLDLVHKLPRTDAFFVRKSGETIATPGFPAVSEGDES